MPGWHAKTKQLVAADKLIVLGLAPEQHGDRMALFLQWKGMEDMTVLLDSYNVLGLKGVPITLLIDESGVVRHRNPKPADLETFLAASPAKVGSAPPAPRFDDYAGHSLPLSRSSEPPEELTAIENFQRGVAHRKLYDRDGAAADPEHFARAVLYWRRALEMDPSNYIWRRRLQQFGPRLDKPYPFYDWIETARRELKARGIEPHPLRARLTGAEIAQPLRAPEAGEPTPHPDPRGELPRDESDLVRCSTLVVPHTKDPQKAVRLFVTLAPNPERSAKWNDEAGVSTIRLAPSKGWSASQPVIALPPPEKEADREMGPRTVEFELRRSGAAGGNGDPDHENELGFQLFYNVCHGENRVCQFLRRDVEVSLELKKPSVKTLPPK